MMRFLTTRRFFFLAVPVLVAAAVPFSMAAAAEGAGLTPEQVASLRQVGEVQIAPDGGLVAYTLTVPRIPGRGDDGAAWSELWVVPAAGGMPRPYVHGEVSVSRVRFTPDGGSITYVAKRDDDEHASLWSIPVDGGESRRLVDFDESVGEYRVSPDGSEVAFLALEPQRKARKEAKERGFDQEVFEEDWRPRKLWIAPMPGREPGPAEPWDGAVDEDDDGEDESEPRALDLGGSVFDVRWMPDSARLLVTVAPRPLIDDRYMLRRARVVDAESGRVLARIENPGKLDALEPSPDGKTVALLSAADYNDPSPGRLLVAPTSGGALRDLLPGLEGHVRALAWQDAKTVMFLADIGVRTVFGEVDVQSGARKDHYLGGQPDVIEMLPGGGRRMTGATAVLSTLSLSADGRSAAFGGNSPLYPEEVFVMRHGEKEPVRLTASNPWLEGTALAPQEVVRHTARDGLDLEGILIRPSGVEKGRPVPLILVVHGGPEAHMRHGWLTSYSRPGQAAAARGYAVFHPNYRGSTGRGVAFSKLGQGDAAGREYDDLIDAIDHLIAAGVADPAKIGVTGGSYGGYATAWLSTRYTERIAAGVMFVGIGNKLSKGFTTDIPNEDRAVHTLFDPWTKWEFSLERSPLYHAEKSKTPLLIMGGTADTRVHPSQSLQLYRALKLMGKTVRYVRYPGEQHGNRRAAARYDYSKRLLEWFDHYLKGPGGEPPPWDLGLGEDDDEEDDDDDD